MEDGSHFDPGKFYKQHGNGAAWSVPFGTRLGGFFACVFGLGPRR